MTNKDLTPHQKRIVQKLAGFDVENNHSKAIFKTTMAHISEASAYNIWHQRQIQKDLVANSSATGIALLSHRLRTLAPVAVVAVVLVAGGSGIYIRNLQTQQFNKSQTQSVEANGSIENTILSITSDLTAESQLAQDSFNQTENSVKTVSSIANSLGEASNAQNF